MMSGPDEDPAEQALLSKLGRTMARTDAYNGIHSTWERFHSKSISLAEVLITIQRLIHRHGVRAETDRASLLGLMIASPSKAGLDEIFQVYWPK